MSFREPDLELALRNKNNCSLYWLLQSSCASPPPPSPSRESRTALGLGEYFVCQVRSLEMPLTTAGPIVQGNNQRKVNFWSCWNVRILISLRCGVGEFFSCSLGKTWQMWSDFCDCWRERGKHKSFFSSVKMSTIYIWELLLSISIDRWWGGGSFVSKANRFDKSTSAFWKCSKGKFELFWRKCVWVTLFSWTIHIGF